MKRLLPVVAGATFLLVAGGGGSAAYAAHSAEQSQARARHCAPLLASDVVAEHPYLADVAKYRRLSKTNLQSSRPVILISLTMARDMLTEQQHDLQHPECYSAADVKLGKQEVATLLFRIQYELGRLAKT